MSPSLRRRVGKRGTQIKVVHGRKGNLGSTRQKKSLVLLSDLPPTSSNDQWPFVPPMPLLRLLPLTLLPSLFRTLLPLPLSLSTSLFRGDPSTRPTNRPTLPLVPCLLELIAVQPLIPPSNEALLSIQIRHYSGIIDTVTPPIRLVARP